MPVAEQGFPLAEAWSGLSGGGVPEAVGMLSLFVGLLFLGSMFLPGSRATGPGLEGESRTYKLNGLAAFLIVMTAAGLAQAFGWFSLSVLHDHFAALFLVANGFAFAMSGWMYARTPRTPAGPAGFWRRFFFGAELNPALLGVDLKLFSYRPSLIGLALFNLSFAVVQYDIYGRLSLPMVLYQVFTFVYVLSYFQFEQGMTHTWDLVSERFGWMLIWGDYVLVPFFYSLPGWWLVHATEPLPLAGTVAIVLLFAFGFWVFRGANEQKHRFKRDPDAPIWGRPARSLDGRLLISGFWGIGRHLNYTGEICVYLAFTLTTGFSSWIPYLLPAWLAGLLVHRCRRDERRCRAKYGELWDRYKRRVRFAMLPFIY